MFASRHTSKIDRPPSACLKIRILSSVLYFLPFIRLVPFGPDYLIPRLEKAQSRHQNFAVGEHDRILFTTFTKNLAEDILQNLRKICSVELLRKIEVINLD